MQYNVAQALGDLGAGGGGGSAAGDAAGAGFGFALGMTMPYLIARAYRWPVAWPFGHGPALPAGPAPLALPPAPRFCGHCGGGLTPQARYCGHCGEAVSR